jgi:formylglycine-generating enzyme required for sulfatase activity
MVSNVKSTRAAAPIVSWASLCLSSLVALTGPLHAADQNQWSARREAEFSRWRAAHPAVLRQLTKGAPSEIWDAAQAPKMVIIPAGEYSMGSPAGEPHRGPSEDPLHRVRIGYAFAVGKYNVTRGEFAQFIAETHYTANPAGCRDTRAGGGAGTTTAYYWGDEPGTGNANCDGCGSRWDRVRTSPAGNFAPNAFGLYDMTGNVWQLVRDCWNDSYAGAPVDGSPWLAGDCSKHPRRGGSFHSHISLTGPPPMSTSYVRVAMRASISESSTQNLYGFRVARTL